MKSTINELFHPLVSVMGISMGDEGKGRVAHEILDLIENHTGESATGVMKVNGGANAGHTAAGLKLNLLPSGVGNPKINDLIIGSGVVADPRKFIWEATPLEAKGISVYDRLQIDEKCQVSDLSHRLLDLAWENYRVNQLGRQSRGSTGRGISPAYCDETGQWQIFFNAFKEDRSIFAKELSGRLNRAMDTIKFVCKVSEEDWFGFFSILTEAESRANKSSIDQELFSKEEFDFSLFAKANPFEVNFELLEETYWQAGKRLCKCITDIRENVLSNIEKKRSIVVEFGQSYWLDKRHGFTPNVTASHTYSSEVFQSAGIPLQEISQVGCCKAYDTKVGTHHFITRIDMEDHPLGKKLAKLEFGTSTGRQRMVGWFDAVEKGNALRFGGFDWLVINKLDALSRTREDFDHLKICVAYEDIDGNRTTTVPRTESQSLNLKPVYEIFPVWEENLSECTNFSDLPLNARRYVSRMFSSMLDVAFPNGYTDKDLPQLLFLGVGPDPKQIIGEIPAIDNILSILDNG